VVWTLDLLGDGLTLFVGPNWDGWLRPEDADTPPVTMKRLDAIAACGLGLTRAGSLLPRPDGEPVALLNGDQSVRSAAGAGYQAGERSAAHEPRVGAAGIEPATSRV
jgi:hypothetical protein